MQHIFRLTLFGSVSSTSLPAHLAGHIAKENTEKFPLDRHDTAQTPPTYLWHTADDNGVPAQNSLMYAHALAEHGVPFSLHIYPHGAHGLSTADNATCEHLEENVAPATHWPDHLKNWLKITL